MVINYLVVNFIVLTALPAYTKTGRVGVCSDSYVLTRGNVEWNF